MDSNTSPIRRSRRKSPMTERMANYISEMANKENLKESKVISNAAKCVSGAEKYEKEIYGNEGHVYGNNNMNRPVLIECDRPNSMHSEPFFRMVQSPQLYNNVMSPSQALSRGIDLLSVGSSSQTKFSQCVGCEETRRELRTVKEVIVTLMDKMDRSYAETKEMKEVIGSLMTNITKTFAEMKEMINNNANDVRNLKPVTSKRKKSARTIGLWKVLVGTNEYPIESVSESILQGELDTMRKNLIERNGIFESDALFIDKYLDINISKSLNYPQLFGRQAADIILTKNQQLHFKLSAGTVKTSDRLSMDKSMRDRILDIYRYAGVGLIVRSLRETYMQAVYEGVNGRASYIMLGNNSVFYLNRNLEQVLLENEEKLQVPDKTFELPRKRPRKMKMNEETEGIEENGGIEKEKSKDIEGI